MADQKNERKAYRPNPKRRSKKLAFASASDLKKETFYALENVSRAKLPGKIIGIGLFILIVMNAILVFVSAQPGLDPIASGALNAFYTFSTVCFFLEYIARIWIADLAFGNCTRVRARIKYVFSPLGIIDLLSFAPNMIAWFMPMSGSVRTVINVVRLVRLVKISRYMRGLRTIGRVLEKHRHEIVASFLVIALLVVVASVVMYEIEHPVQPKQFDSLLSGIYWAITTITATGYGDLVPITPLGRIVGSLIMFLSIALIAIPGGIFSAGFVAEFQNASLRKIERDVNKEEHDKKSVKSSDVQSVDASSDNISEEK